MYISNFTINTSSENMSKFHLLKHILKFPNLKNVKIYRNISEILRIVKRQAMYYLTNIVLYFPLLFRYAYVSSGEWGTVMR